MSAKFRPIPWLKLEPENLALFGNTGSAVLDMYVWEVIRFRCRTEHRDRSYEHSDGMVWWRGTIDDLMADLGGLTERPTRSALDRLVVSGRLVRDRHYVGGPYDRTWSYREATILPLASDSVPSSDENVASTSDENVASFYSLEGTKKEQGEDVATATPKPASRCRDKRAEVDSGFELMEVGQPTHSASLHARAGLPDGFDEFWSKYRAIRTGRESIGPKKPAEVKYRQALRAVSHDFLMDALDAYRAGLDREQFKRNVKHASTWLHQEGWTEFEASSPRGLTEGMDALIAARDWSAAKAECRAQGWDYSSAVPDDFDGDQSFLANWWINVKRPEIVGRALGDQGGVKVAQSGNGGGSTA